MNLLCASSHSEVMKVSSSLTSCHLHILSRLSSSLIWAQLTLSVPAWGTRSLSLQDGAPIHRVRAHSLTGIQNTFYYLIISLSRRRAIIIVSKFEKLPRAWFCFNQRQNSAENRTAHTVHCQKEIFDFFQKLIIYNTVNRITSNKM
jgi:hypothetical protein